MESKEQKEQAAAEALSKYGLSLQSFLQFLQVIRRTPAHNVANGDDLNVWTMEELMENVEKYRTLQAPSSQPAPPGSAGVPGQQMRPPKGFVTRLWID